MFSEVTTPLCGRASVIRLVKVVLGLFHGQVLEIGNEISNYIFIEGVFV